MLALVSLSSFVSPPRKTVIPNYKLPSPTPPHLTPPLSTPPQSVLSLVTGLNPAGPYRLAIGFNPEIEAAFAGDL